MKKCSKCGEEKRLSEFPKHKNCKDGHRNQCKSCEKEYKKEYYQENKEYKKEYSKEWYQENKEYKKEYQKKYRKENKEKRNEYIRKKRKNDPLFRLKLCIRNIVNRAIKTKRTQEIIGCSFQELKLHLESQFTEGMSWENYGYYGWHVDHKKPLSWFDLTNPDEVDKANHYSNLQPMWAEENLSKGNRFAS